MYQFHGAVIFIPEERVGLVRGAQPDGKTRSAFWSFVSLAHFEMFRISKASDTPMFKCKDEEWFAATSDAVWAPTSSRKDNGKGQRPGFPVPPVLNLWARVKRAKALRKSLWELFRRDLFVYKASGPVSTVYC